MTRSQCSGLKFANNWTESLSRKKVCNQKSYFGGFRGEQVGPESPFVTAIHSCTINLSLLSIHLPQSTCIRCLTVPAKIMKKWATLENKQNYYLACLESIHFSGDSRCSCDTMQWKSAAGLLSTRGSNWQWTMDNNSILPETVTLLAYDEDKSVCQSIVLFEFQKFSDCSSSHSALQNSYQLVLDKFHIFLPTIPLTKVWSSI